MEMTERDPTATKGTQSLHRATSLLRMLAARPGLQLRLSDLSSQSGLSISTTHRILQGLVSEGWVTQDGRTSQYLLGPLAYEIGLAARKPARLHQLAGVALDRLANESGDTAFLSVRSDLEAVCIDRREGSFPIRALVLDIGGRRPLGVGAGAMALLMAMPDEEINQILQRIDGRLAAYKTNAEVLRAGVKRSRKLGFAFNDGHILAGHKGVALPFRDPAGAVIGALSLAAISERVSPPRCLELVRILRREARLLESELRTSVGLSPRTGTPLDE